MKIKWKYSIIIVLDIVLAVYLFMAMTKWNKPEDTVARCTKVTVNIADESESGFLNSEEVKKLLTAKKMYPLSKPLKEIKPREIEGQLVQMPFVNTAKCSITKEGHVNITITQRTPLVRVKSFTGEDYYIDDNGGVMPNSQYTSDMIVVTGHVSKPYACQYMSCLTRIIMNDPLWKNQIEQINITPSRSVELVPRVGDNIINIGQLPMSSDKKQREEQIEQYVKQQLDRLMLFYRYGLKEAGWNKYEYISLEFSNQIVCRKRDEKAMEANEEETSEEVKKDEKKEEPKKKVEDSKKKNN